MELEIRQVTKEEIVRVHELEAEGYPEDEAATYEMLLYRWKEAPDLTLAGFRGEEMIGFVCGTRYHGDKITNDSMKMHIPNGNTSKFYKISTRHPGFIYLLDIIQLRTRSLRPLDKGVAVKLLDNYVQAVKSEQKDVSQILLMCKSNLIPLYTRVGFVLRGKSDVVHGKDPWYELSLSVAGANS